MIDLHIHSVLSDGTDDVQTLVEKINKKGIKIFSITDHDNFEACKVINKNYINYLKDNKIKIINGVEFSSDFNGESMHVLAYNFDVNNKIMQDLVEESKNKRHLRILKRLELLKKENGIIFTEEELNKLNSINDVGKPHIAKLLIEKGYAKTISEAITKFLYHKLPNEKLGADYIIENINKAGGIAVLAHPLGGEGEHEISKIKFENNVKKLIKYGLKGLECYYSKYDILERKIILNCGEKYNLLFSGGSDYHGENKTTILGNLGKNYDLNINDFTILNLIN